MPSDPTIIPDEYEDTTYGITSISNDETDEDQDGDDEDFSF